MKQVNTQNQIWFEESERGVVKVGFTRSFLDQLDQCWQIIPANLRMFKKNAPLLIVETNDALISITAPVGGALHSFTDTARNFPDQLTENDAIISILRDGVVAVVDNPRNDQDAALEELRRRVGVARAGFGRVPEGGILNAGVLIHNQEF